MTLAQLCFMSVSVASGGSSAVLGRLCQSSFSSHPWTLSILTSWFVGKKNHMFLRTKLCLCKQIKAPCLQGLHGCSGVNTNAVDLNHCSWLNPNHKPLSRTVTNSNTITVMLSAVCFPAEYSKSYIQPGPQDTGYFNFAINKTLNINCSDASVVKINVNMNCESFNIPKTTKYSHSQKPHHLYLWCDCFCAGALIQEPFPASLIWAGEDHGDVSKGTAAFGNSYPVMGLNERQQAYFILNYHHSKGLSEESLTVWVALPMNRYWSIVI